MKKFTTYDEQLELLKSRNLLVEDDKFLLSKLKDVGYYNLINGYSDIFKKGDIYKNNASDKDILALYDFDKSIRNIVYKYILKFESRLKSMISYVFSKYHGEDEKKYLIRSSFDKDINKETRIANLISDLNDIIEKGCDKKSGRYRTYISHYVDHHGHVPFWVLIRAMTFGDISRFYSNMILSEKTEIANEFSLNPSEFESMLKMLVAFRNVVAHDERLYCKQLQNEILSSNLAVYHIMRIEKSKDNSPMAGRKDFLSLMIVLKYFLNDEEFKEFWAEFINARKVLIDTIKSHFIAIINNKMGLKNRWKNLLNYNRFEN